MKLSNIFNRIKGTLKKDYTPKPLVQKEGMCIHEVPVWGIPYEERKSVVRCLTLMEPLKFKRDKNYKYDKNAIRIVTKNKKTIGYLPPYVSKNLVSLNDEDLDFKSTIIQLKKDHEGKTHGVHIAICLPERLMPTISPKLEFVLDEGASGNLYVLLNCESKMIENIIDQLKQSGLSHMKWGQSIKPASVHDDRQYKWYIKLDDTVEENQIIEFFKKYYAIQPWERIDDLITKMDALISRLHDYNQDEELLYEDIEKLEEVQKEQDQCLKNIRDELHNAKKEIRENTIKGMLPNINFCRNSLKVILKEFLAQKEMLFKLEKIQVSPESVKSECFHGSNNWREISNQGKNPIRIYFKRNNNNTKEVLVSYKKNQSKDEDWMKEN